MKFTIIFTILSALFFAAVSAAPRLTNAERLARGLSPNPPARRMTRVSGEHIFFLLALRLTKPACPHSGEEDPAFGNS